MAARMVELVKSSRIYPLVRRVRSALLEQTPASRRQRRRERALYAQFMGPGDLVFDVGANLGRRTRTFLALGARVVAVEPQPVLAQTIERRNAGNPRLEVVASAVGAEPGEAEMFLGDTHMLGTLSAEWIERVQSSGRFQEERWTRTVRVPVTTLDLLVARHGTPGFCKIDVEGFEWEVVRGLSRPVRALSFEFVPESPAIARCVRHLEGLGPYRFNYSMAEGMTLELAEWVPGDQVLARIEAMEKGNDWGDVYARLAPAAAS